MISIRTLTPICFVAAATLALAQTPPTPPAATTPAPAPKAATAPPAPPSPGMHMLLGPSDAVDFSGLADQIKEKIGTLDKLDLKNTLAPLTDLNIDLNIDVDQIAAKAREQAERAMDQVRDLDLDQIKEQAREQAEQAREQAQQAREQAREQAQQARDQIREQFGQDWNAFGKGFALAPFAAQTPMAPMPPMPPQPKVYVNMRGRGVDSLYERGLSDLDGHRYDQALDCFTEVATRAAAHADGALYWKAYTLNKLGRRDDANAALAELRKAYPSSHWLDDAKALEIEVKQSAGQKVSPESESNDELKLLALEGLVQSDPDRAFPILDQLLKKAQSPSFKRKAIYVLALNNSPRAQQLLEQIARGGGNPDMQIIAIQYMGVSSKNANKAQVLFEIYNASSDNNVKRAVMRALQSNRDKDHLLQIAKNEKNPEMRQEAIRYIGSTASAPEMWSLYQSETDPDAKRTILDYMSGNTDKLIEVAKTEKDAKLRRSAIQRLGSTKAAAATDALVQIYGTESDQGVKHTIVDSFAGQRNATALVAVARKENDVDMKRYIVRRMLDLKSSPEINQFLEEILK